MTIKYEGEPVRRYRIEIKPQVQSRLGRLLKFTPVNIVFSMSPGEKPHIPEDMVLRSAGRFNMLRLKGSEINSDRICRINAIEWVPE